MYLLKTCVQENHDNVTLTACKANVRDIHSLLEITAYMTHMRFFIQMLVQCVGICIGVMVLLLVSTRFLFSQTSR